MLGRVTDQHQSGWVSTSEKFDVAQTFAAPVGRSELQPPSWWRGNRKTSEGWVYEIEPTGNIVSFATEARNELQKRMTAATKEWVAVKKITSENIIRATKYRRDFPADKNGRITSFSENDAPFQKIETWDNPQYRQGARGYDPYQDSSSGWSDTVDLFGHLGEHPQRGVAEADARDHVVPRSCSSSPVTRAADSDCGIVEWAKVRERAKQTVKSVLADQEHTQSLPRRKPGGLATEENLKVAEQTRTKVTALNGARVAATSAGIALWATGMARTFTDQSATTLDKVTVTMSIVPGVGQALGIADGIQHQDAEAIAVNAVSMTALVAAQAIPVVGELVDTALLADQLVDAVAGLFPHFESGPPARLPIGAVPDMPTVKASIDCTVWSQSMDITWQQPTVQLPPETRVVVKERGGSESTHPVSDGKSPGWLPPVGGLGTSKTFDVSFLLGREWATFQSEKRTVVKATSKLLYCDTSAWEEPW